MSIQETDRFSREGSRLSPGEEEDRSVMEDAAARPVDEEGEEETPAGQPERDTGARLVIPFFAVMAVLTVAAFLLPLRPTQSQMEKRNLAQFPEFSWESVTDGAYFDAITLWFSDTFPGRESWITLSQRISGFHGSSEISFSGDLNTEQIPQEQIRAAEETAPATDPGEETLPDRQTEAAASATEETIAEETIAEETEWGGVDAANREDTDIAGQAGVIQIGDSAFNAIGFSQMCSDKYAGALNKLAKNVADSGVQVVSAPAPTAVGIMIEPEFLEQLKCANQDDTIGYMHDQMDDGIVKVDTYDALVSHNDEYIYFRTDHHWTGRGAYYAYVGICEALGYEPVPLEDCEEWDQGEFKGSLCHKAPQPWKLKADTLIAYVPQMNIELKVRSMNYEGTVRPLIQDMTQRKPNAKYSAFLFGDNAMVEVTNYDLPDGPTCVVIKDSFGNCLVPFLAQNYYKVYALDYRKFHDTSLQGFLKKFPVDQVIFTPYVIATQSQDGAKMFQNLCR